MYKNNYNYIKELTKYHTPAEDRLYTCYIYIYILVVLLPKTCD